MMLFGNTRTCVNSDLKVLSTLFLALHSYFPASLSDADSIISLDLVLEVQNVVKSISKPDYCLYSLKLLQFDSLPSSPFSPDSRLP